MDLRGTEYIVGAKGTANGRPDGRNQANQARVDDVLTSRPCSYAGAQQSLQTSAMKQNLGLHRPRRKLHRFPPDMSRKGRSWPADDGG
jgi:hypothetical protein